MWIIKNTVSIIAVFFLLCWFLGDVARGANMRKYGHMKSGRKMFAPTDFFVGIYVKLNVFDSVFNIKVTNCNFCSDICSYGI